MPKKKSEQVIEEENTEVIIERQTNIEPQANYLSPNIAIPRSYTHYYVLLLVVFAFLIGALTTKIQYLQENKNKPVPVVPNAQAQQPAAPAAHVDVANGHFPVMGKEDAKITIVEFADPRCPFCKQFFDVVLPDLKKDYIDTGKAKLYFRNFDFLGAPSTFAGNTLECANEQGKFWDMHNYLFKNQPSESDTTMFTTDKFAPIAEELGMDTTQFNSCLSSTKDAKAVTQDMTEGQKAGVSGTPTFFINGTSLVGAQPYSAFKLIIDKELAK